MIGKSSNGTLSPGSYFGAAVRSQIINGFILTENTYHPHHFVPAHEHERGFFYFVLDGSSIDVCSGRTLTCTPSTLVFHPAGETHSNSWHRNGGRCLHLETPPGRLELLSERSPPLQRVGHFTGGMPVWLASKLHDEFRRPDAASALAMEGLLLELIAAVCRERESTDGGRYPRWLISARELILERCTENLSITDLAAEAGVHPTHFARAFRKAFACSIGEFVRKARVERACKQITSGHSTLSEVAYDSGFCDQSHFCKSFKRVLGMTPSQFRHRFGGR